VRRGVLHGADELLGVEAQDLAPQLPRLVQRLPPDGPLVEVHQILQVPGSHAVKGTNGGSARQGGPGGGVPGPRPRYTDPSFNGGPPARSGTTPPTRCQ